MIFILKSFELSSLEHVKDKTDLKVQCTLYSTVYCVGTEEGCIQKRRQRSSLLFGGQNWLNSLPHQLFCGTRTIWRVGWKYRDKRDNLTIFMTPLSWIYPTFSLIKPSSNFIVNDFDFAKIFAIVRCRVEFKAVEPKKI